MSTLYRAWSAEAFRLLDCPQTPADYWRVRDWSPEVLETLLRERSQVTEEVWRGLHPSDRRRVAAAVPATA